MKNPVKSGCKNAALKHKLGKERVCARVIKRKKHEVNE